MPWQNLRRELGVELLTIELGRILPSEILQHLTMHEAVEQRTSEILLSGIPQLH